MRGIHLWIGLRKTRSAKFHVDITIEVAVRPVPENFDVDITIEVAARSVPEKFHVYVMIEVV